MSMFTRFVPLDDIAIRSDGTGRTVEAYAAVFGVAAPVSDQDGRYLERVDAQAFAKTLADNGTRFGVFYNHGLSIHGTPSERASMPLGTPTEIRADSRGLLTVTRYNKTPLADEVLEAIRNGDIRGQSFSGRFVRSDKKPPRGGWRAAADGSLVEVNRLEIALREYGPTPFPTYQDAAIVGVRSSVDVVEALRDLDEEKLAAVRAALGLPTQDAPGTDTATPQDGAGTATPQPEGQHVGRVITPQQRAAMARILRRD